MKLLEIKLGVAWHLKPIQVLVVWNYNQEDATKLTKQAEIIGLAVRASILFIFI